MTPSMTSDDIAALFTHSPDSFRFARWGRPIAPVVFGVTDDTLAVVKGALEAAMVLSGHQMAETDPELGSNLMIFFFRDWHELPEVEGMDQLVPDLGPLVMRLEAAQANQYRFFRFDAAGAIKACFVFLRMDSALADLPAQVLALGQVVQTMLLWSDRAFADQSPLTVIDGQAVLRPEIGALVRAAYDPVLPAASTDPSHALRLAARLAAAEQNARRQGA